MTVIKIPIPNSKDHLEVYISAEVDSVEQPESQEIEELLCKRMELACGKELQQFFEAIGQSSTIMTD